MHESNQPECTTGAFSVDGSEDKFGGRNGRQYWVILFVDLKVFLEDLQGQVYVRTEADKSNREISDFVSVSLERVSAVLRRGHGKQGMYRSIGGGCASDAEGGFMAQEIIWANH